jgi:hypothetical protein
LVGSVGAQWASACAEYCAADDRSSIVAWDPIDGQCRCMTDCRDSADALNTV